MLIRLKNVCLAFGTHALLDNTSIAIHKGEHIGLVGRNGVGKSTFLKLLAGEIKPDSGEVEYATGVNITYLPQAIPDIEGNVHDVIAAPLQGQLEDWDITRQVDRIIGAMSLDGAIDFNALSGGLKRRVLIARALVEKPDVLLLDEPTNHLDITTISQLENDILEHKSCIIFISHDRQFIRKLSTKMFDLDRGRLSSFDCGYDDFLKRKEEALHSESEEWRKFDKKLAQEEIWIRQGIKARRTRNEGRVRALKALREQKSQRRQRIGNVKLAINEAQKSGKLVLEAENIDYAYGEKCIAKDFTVCVTRGDKIGIIGPNGCGKTTLIQILLQKLKPQSGIVEHGTNLEIAYFDQLREQIDDEGTVLDNISQGQSHVTFQDRSMHIMSYLQEFLFAPERAFTKAKSLSGGERNRLLLAKMFTKPANFLIMDEPTNDLDLETLELLEELLTSFSGTLFLVSHDREFINNVVTSTLVFEGNGKIAEYVGGYDDYLRQSKPETVQPLQKSEKKPASKLSYEERKELKKLPNKIEKLEAKIADFRQQLADSSLYQQDPDKATQLSQAMKKAEQELEVVFARWELLEAK